MHTKPKNLGLLAFFFALTLTSCSTPFTNRDVTGQSFPSVTGQSLAGEEKTIPNDLLDGPTIVLLGYVQNAQFDIDRWLIGLDMTQTQAKVYELPTIKGLFPRMFSTQIDNGMRKGIPKELWGGVITIYADGEAVQAFTGNQNPNNARVLLLDAKGTVGYFYDRGFSVDALNTLRDKLEQMAN